MHMVLIGGFVRDGELDFLLFLNGGGLRRENDCGKAVESSQIRLEITTSFGTL